MKQRLGDYTIYSRKSLVQIATVFDICWLPFLGNLTRKQERSLGNRDLAVIISVCR